MPQNLMAITELSRAASVPVSTIKFYLRKGLLPQPIKTGQTMAYYTGAHRERLVWIKKMQTEEGLSLRQIKQSLQQAPSQSGEKSPRSENNRLARENRVIDAAIAVFRQEGYEKTTITDIIEAAGIGRASFYTLFANKKDLFSRCLEKIFQDTHQEVWGGKNAEQEPNLIFLFEERIAAFFREYPAWRDMMTLLRAAAVKEPDVFQEKFDQALEMNIRHISGEIEQRKKQGEIRALDPRLVAVLALGMLDYAAYYTLNGKLDKTPEEMLREGMDIFLNGIRKKES